MGNKNGGKIIIKNHNKMEMDKHLQHIHLQRAAPCSPSWAARPAAQCSARRAHAHPLPAECTPQAKRLQPQTKIINEKQNKNAK